MKPLPVLVTGSSGFIGTHVVRHLSFVGKIAGFVSAMNVIPFVDPKIGVIVFGAASILKDAVNREMGPASRMVSAGRPDKSTTGASRKPKNM